MELDGSGWEEENEKWASRESIWYMTIDWVNFVDYGINKDSELYTLMFRYWTMLYYGVLNLGSNEFGPVNEIEMLYLVITLIISALMNALLFGDVAGLVSQLSQ